jgi:hypothetical protein
MKLAVIAVAALYLLLPFQASAQYYDPYYGGPDDYWEGDQYQYGEPYYEPQEYDRAPLYRRRRKILAHLPQRLVAALSRSSQANILFITLRLQVSSLPTRSLSAGKASNGLGQPALCQKKNIENGDQRRKCAEKIPSSQL